MKIKDKDYPLEVNNAPDTHIGLWGNNIHGTTNLICLKRKDILKLANELIRINNVGVEKP